MNASIINNPQAVGKETRTLAECAGTMSEPGFLQNSCLCDVPRSAGTRYDACPLPVSLRCRLNLMRQIKIFKGVEAEVTALSEEVNDWIRSNRINVVRISGNIAPQSDAPVGSGNRFPPSDVFILVEYESE